MQCQLGPAGVIAALLAGAVVLLVMPRQRGGIARGMSGRVAGADHLTPSFFARLLRGSQDAAPLWQRIAVSGAGAVALGLATRGLGGVFETLGWAAMPVLTITGVTVLGQLEPARARRRRMRLVLEVPQALELLSACLAAGMPLRQGTAAVVRCYEGPVADDLGQVLSLIALGITDAEAWLSLKDHPQLGPAALDLARSVESGTMMVDVLVHHARDARSLRRASLEMVAKTVGVRSVLPLMTCFLPAFLLIGVVPTVASALAHAFS
jgi:pilus assembly protein TadC